MKKKRSTRPHRSRRANLGQHFLRSQSALSAIEKAGNLNKNDVVLEIGPGHGFLTKKLLKSGAKVIAVEKDAGLCRELAERFEKEMQLGQLVLINRDIRDFGASMLGFNKVIANIPYYITGEILRTFLGATHQPTSMVLLVQKEVAERIVAKNDKESLLSISVKAYGVPSYVKTVKRASFSPPPAVDSAILSIKDISRNFFGDVDESFFFSVVRKGFSHKRKLLSGNLRIPGAELEKVGVSATARAEDLSISDWKNLVKNM